MQAALLGAGQGENKQVKRKAFVIQILKIPINSRRGFELDIKTDTSPTLGISSADINCCKHRASVELYTSC